MLKFTNEGIVELSTEEIIQNLNNYFIQMYPDNPPDVSPNSINGMLISMIAELIIQNNNSVISLSQNFNIYGASGIYLDYIGGIFGILRNEGVYSTIPVTISGLSGSTVEIGIEIQDSSGVIWINTSSVTIPNSGSTSVIFRNSQYGNYLPTSGPLTPILILIGVDSFTYSSGGTAGKDIETDGEFRGRILNFSSSGNTNNIESVQYALSQISTDFILIENNTQNDIVRDDVTISRQTLWICSQQGSDQEIAYAIYTSKPAGICTLGTSSYSFGDYAVYFNRPTIVTKTIVVNLKFTTLQPSNFTDIIKTEILKVFPTISKIGQTIFTSYLVDSLINIGIYDIISVTIDGSTEVIPKITELFSTNYENISVLVN